MTYKILTQTKKIDLNNQEEILEIKFSGGGIKPEELSLNEISSKIKLLYELISPIIEEQNPGVETDSNYIGLTDVGNKSISFKYIIKKNKKIVLTAFTFLITSMNDFDISKLPPKTIETLASNLKSPVNLTIAGGKIWVTESQIRHRLQPGKEAEVPKQFFIRRFLYGD